jgi:hypothetical protein
VRVVDHLEQASLDRDRDERRHPLTRRPRSPSRQPHLCAEHGHVAIVLPPSAIGDSDLLMRCVGDLSETVLVTAGSARHWFDMMVLLKVEREVVFVIDPGELPPDEFLRIGFRAHDDETWRVDKCTLERI